MKIDYKKLGVLLLPTFLRGKALVSLVRVLMMPLQRLHDEHHAAREARMFGLAHTGQVCRMKDALNKAFSLGQYASGGDYGQGFEVEDVAVKGDWQVVYAEENAFVNRHVLAMSDADDAVEMVCTEEEILQLTKNFVVHVPMAEEEWLANADKVKDIVEHYRLVSRKPVYELRTKN